MKCNSNEVQEMFLKNDLSTDVLLRWSKLLEYDFFRLYSQHLILYSPQTRNNSTDTERVSKLPYFKKNIYTREIIEYMLELIHSGEMTKQQVVEKYRIPKTTLFKWIAKYNKEKTE
ncbi:hypothetical protein [Chryseobacterium sp. SIMBA_028]|uniref:hypothetical protein n=1 Tax=Chryseobacterium sp. SIMBA_028 TaxID=3085771 RepID=UPI00397E18CD